MKFDLNQVMERINQNKFLSALTIAVALGLIAYLDALGPPELLTDALYAIPIWIGLVAFSWPGGLVVATMGIGCFYFSNYFFMSPHTQSVWFSLLVTYALLLAFCYGAYKFLVNQRRLDETRQTLQKQLLELDQLHQETQALHQQRLQLAVVNERNRIAREIHDVLAQGLMAIILQAEAARLHRHDQIALQERLSKVEELARFHLQEARRSVADLRPLPLEGKSLIEALQTMVAEFETETGVAATFTASGQQQPLPAQIEAALYRISQEALSNVAHHAAAQKVTVSLDYDDDEICLTIQDDGHGFDTQAALSEAETGPRERPKSFGLSTMQERTRLIGGWITIQSSPAAGSRVRVIVPYQSAA